MFEHTLTAYKLFNYRQGALQPLYVKHPGPLPLGVWLAAADGHRTPKGKVTSKIGPLAYRPGWHCSTFPAAIHIGLGKPKPRYRPSWQVWARVLVPADVDWQSEAERRAKRRKDGGIVASTAHITDEIPFGGYYRYKTNANMLGAWIISGHMCILDILSDEEVAEINARFGVADLPRVFHAQAVA